MSNSSYTKVKNSVQAGVIKPSVVSGSMVSDSADASVIARANAVRSVAAVTPTTANLTLSDAQLLEAQASILTIDGAGLTAARSLLLGSDTYARAAALQSLLGITSTSQKVFLRMHLIETSAAFALSLANADGTTVAVTVALVGGAGAATQVMAASTATTTNGDILIMVTAASVTPLAETIKFDILKAAST